jgi:hypothetical protein
MKFGWIPGLRQPLAQLAAICLLVAGCSHAEPEYTQQALSVKGENRVLDIPAGMRLELLTTALNMPRLMHLLPNADLSIGAKSGNSYRLGSARPCLRASRPPAPHAG